jgi:ABC-type branched-subunit amino acid transport system permease subunit
MMKKKINIIDAVKIILIELVLFILLMVFFQVESVWMLVGLLLLVVLIVVVNRLFKDKVENLKDLFRNNRPVVLGCLVVLLVLYPIISPLMVRQSTYWILILIQTGLYLITALGLNIQLGSSGMMNLASAAFYGIGAYTAGMLSLKMGVPAILTIPAAGLVSGLFGLILYVPIYKTKGHYLALVTMAFGLMVILALDNTEFTGASQGLMNIPSMSFFGYDFLNSFGGLHFYTNYYYLMLILVILALLVTGRLFNSWVGLTLATIRDDEVAAKCCGVNTNRWKLTAFVTGTAFMGVAGGFYAHMIGFISPPNFQFVESLFIVSIVILGGMDNILGVVVGTLILVILPEKMRVITEYRVLIYGLLIVVMLIFRPEGLLPFKPRKYHPSLSKIMKRGKKV